MGARASSRLMRAEFQVTEDESENSSEDEDVSVIDSQEVEDELQDKVEIMGEQPCIQNGQGGLTQAPLLKSLYIEKSKSPDVTQLYASSPKMDRLDNDSGIGNGRAVNHDINITAS